MDLYCTCTLLCSCAYMLHFTANMFIIMYIFVTKCMTILIVGAEVCHAFCISSLCTWEQNRLVVVFVVVFACGSYSLPSLPSLPIHCFWIQKSKQLNGSSSAEYSQKSRQEPLVPFNFRHPDHCMPRRKGHWNHCACIAFAPADERDSKQVNTLLYCLNEEAESVVMLCRMAEACNYGYLIDERIRNRLVAHSRRRTLATTSMDAAWTHPRQFQGMYPTARSMHGEEQKELKGAAELRSS